MQRGLDRIKKYLKGSVERQKITEKESTDSVNRITGIIDFEEAAREVDLVIEAVPEDMKLKKEIFLALAKSCRGEAILASNTSTLSITEIASVSDRPEKVIGMHFFNPVQFMKPVEIVKGVLTSEDTIGSIEALALKLDRIPVIVKDSPGFASTRLGVSLFLEASQMLEEGVASKDIDTGARLFYGHRMGPFETCDLVGLDARLNNLNALYQSTSNPKWAAPLLLKQLVASGYWGNKPGSNGGYYTFFGLEKD
ncbi:MAG: 3-hydroxyacyl-CoA dehydrogenase family protein [Chloroflexota bacterium]|nr:MAG: 3-hydroxyacyl-CoA dehydrogenase family protein [Chloroflexota bacterium]